MKKRVLLYVVVVLSALSLQSCVTNYVVSQPTTYTKEYKTDAKLSSVDTKKIEEEKKKLIASLATEKALNEAKTKNTLRNAAITKTVKFNKLIDDLLTEAQTYIGTPYRFGGTTRNGIDCSAFVLSVFGTVAGVQLPRVSSSQAQEGDRIEKDQLQKGDLVFFSHGRGRISHVGIVESVTAEGEVKFIHAATSKGVMISSLDDSYWAPRYRFAKRILTEDSYENLASLKTAETKISY